MDVVRLSPETVAAPSAPSLAIVGLCAVAQLIHALIRHTKHASGVSKTELQLPGTKNPHRLSSGCRRVFLFTLGLFPTTGVDGDRLFDFSCQFHGIHEFRCIGIVNKQS